MTWADLMWFPPLMLAVAVVVGAAGRPRGELGGAIRRSFLALTIGVVAVGVAIRLLVTFFA